MLKNWCAAGRLMLKDMDLEDMAALKVCLLAMGTLLGLSVPFRWKKPAALLAGGLFCRSSTQASLFSLMVMALFLLAALFLCSRPLAAALSMALTVVL